MINIPNNITATIFPQEYIHFQNQLIMKVHFILLSLNA